MVLANWGLEKGCDFREIQLEVIDECFVGKDGV